MNKTLMLTTVMFAITSTSLGCGAVDVQDEGVEMTQKARGLVAPTSLQAEAIDDEVLALRWVKRSTIEVETCFEISATDFDRPTYPFGFIPGRCMTTRNDGQTHIRIRDFEPFDFLSAKTVGKTYFARVRDHELNSTNFSRWSNAASVTLPPPTK